MAEIRHQRLLLSLLIPLFLSIVIWYFLRNTTDSIIITLLVTVVTLVIGSRLFLEDVLSVLKIQPLLDNPNLRNRLSSVATHYQQICSHREGDFFHVTAQEYIEKGLREYEVMLENLAKGSLHLVHKNDIIREKEKLVCGVQHSLFATSIDKLQPDFWDNPHGVRYREWNKAAIEKNVQITRVFIVENEDVLKKSSNILDEIRAQVNDKIDVRVVFYNLIGNEAIKDFGIWDDNLVFYINYIHDKEMLSADILTDEHELIKARDLKRLILSQAKTPVELGLLAGCT